MTRAADLEAEPVYCMTLPARGAFRPKSLARITGMAKVLGRLCYAVTYPDGMQGYHLVGQDAYELGTRAELERRGGVLPPSPR